METKILLISSKPSFIESTKATLEKENNLSLIDEKITTKNLISVIEETQPDVLLLDVEFNKKPSDLIKEIVSDFSKIALIAISPETEKNEVEQILQSGARECVPYPYKSDNLMVSIKRALNPTGNNQADSYQTPVMGKEVKTAKTIVVFSPKGGAGTTTISSSLAISIHKQLKEDVLLIDGKHLFGHVALFFNIRTGNSIIDLITHAGKLDSQLIKQVVVRHTSGVHILPSPNSVAEAQGIRPEDLFKVLQSLQTTFPYIIIDGGNYLDENTVTYMDSSDKILLVSTPDIASLRDARQFIEISATLSYPKDKTLLILKSNEKKSDVKSQEIVKILQMNIFGQIPADGNLALASLNEGVPILLKKPNHPISKEINNITKELLKSISLIKGG